MPNIFLIVSAHSRNKYLLILLLAISYSQVIFSQKDPKIDSLLSVLQKTKDDTANVNTLIDISELYEELTNYSEAMNYAEEGLALAERIGYKKGTAFSHTQIGRVYFGLLNYQEALKNYEIGLRISTETGYKRGMASALTNIGFVYLNQGKYTKSFEIYTAAIILNKEIGNKKNTAANYFNMGIIYRLQGNFPEALGNYLAALSLYKEMGDKKRTGSAYNSIGHIYTAQGNDTEALKSYLASLKINEEIGNKRWISTDYKNLGEIYKTEGKLDKALYYYLESLKIGEEFGDRQAIAYSLNSIGGIYHLQENFAKSLEAYSEGLKLSIEINDHQGIVAFYNNIGNIYFNQRNNSEALKNYLAAIRISDELGNKYNSRIGYGNLASLYALQKNYEEAIKYFKISLKILEDAGDKVNLGTAFSNMGAIYLEMNKLEEADEYLKKAISSLLIFGTKEQLEIAHKNMSLLKCSTGDYQSALEEHQLSTLYRDSAYNESNNKLIAEMQTKYETEKKDKEIHGLENEKLIGSLKLEVQQESLIRLNAEKERIQTENIFNLQQVDLLANEQKLQQLEIEKNEIKYSIQKVESDAEKEVQTIEIKKQTLMKNFLLAGLGIFGLLSFFIYNNYITRQKLKLQTLRVKIAGDLHDDVGSTLSSIYIFSEIAKQQSKEVLPMLETIGESSKKMLDAMADIVWTINPENDDFEKIIDRMRSFAYELLGVMKIDFEFEADDDLNQLKLPMDVRKNLYLIFKEATNNMIKYSGAGRAFFSLKEENKNLTMIIKDNGKGFDINKPLEGNGLKNMKRRAEEMGGKMWIDSRHNEGTTIQLKIAV